jgi:hypothetical protein
MRIIDCILCEDIRKEADGKHSLMGVFNDKIRLRIMNQPNTDNEKVIFRLAIFLRAEFTKEDKIISQAELIIKYASDSVSLGKGNVTIHDDREYSVMILTVYFPQFIYKNDGDIELQLNFFDTNDNLINSTSPIRPIKIEAIQ